ncbi:4'-phosphopantetheinyl transferase superfamily protein [Vibrio mimicus]
MLVENGVVTYINKSIEENLGEGFINSVSISSVDRQALLVLCTFELKAFHEGLYDYFAIPYPHDIQNSVVKRKAEFLAGRVCAAIGWRRLGVEIPTRLLVSRSKRVPYWGKGLIGSISHSDTKAVFFGSSSEKLQSVGVDTQEVLPYEDALLICDRVIDKEELCLINSFGLTLSGAVSIAFSVKESIYKAVSPISKEYFDFLETKIEYIDKDFVKVKIVKEFKMKNLTSKCFKVAYTLKEQHILSYLKLEY